MKFFALLMLFVALTVQKAGASLGFKLDGNL